MKRNCLTGKWEFLPVELWQEQQHRSHVCAWENNRLLVAARTAPPAKETVYFPCAQVSRNPTIQQDPTAYYGEGYANWLED